MGSRGYERERVSEGKEERKKRKKKNDDNGRRDAHAHYSSGVAVHVMELSLQKSSPPSQPLVS